MPPRQYKAYGTKSTRQKYLAAQRAKRYRSNLRYAAPSPSSALVSSGEMKYFDTEKSNTAIAQVTTSWAGTEQDPATFNTLVVPVKGSSIDERVGRRIKVHSIKIRGFIRVDAQSAQSTADGSSYIRVILFQDEQTNGAQVQGETLMQDSASSAGTITSFQNLGALGRFRVLKDKVFTVSDLNLANNTGTTGGLVQAGKKIPFKMFVKFAVPVVVNFNATNGGTVADITDNSFHVLAATDSNAYAPTLNYACRVGYKDI